MDFRNLGITWLGQGGFLLELGGVRIAVDPYLSDSLRGEGLKRSFPPPVSLKELQPDIICCTHDHKEHFDDHTVLPLYEMFPDCMVLGPESVIRHARRLGLNPARMVTLRAGENSYTYNGVRIKPTVDYLDREPQAIGLAVGFGDCRIYISGSTRYENGLVESVLETLDGTPDIIMVCINGRMGNMSDSEAVEIVERLQPHVAIPSHFGLFAKNTADPRPFLEEVTELGIQALMPVPGRREVFPVEVASMEGAKKTLQTKVLDRAMAFFW